MLKIYELSEFYKRISECSSVFCIGTGRRLQMMAEREEYVPVVKKIKALVDNNTSKQHTHIEMGNNPVEVISIPEMVFQIGSNDVVIITCVHYDEILEQLASFEKLDSIDTFCLTHIMSLTIEAEAMIKKVPSNFRITSEPLIPKKIHYCWFGGNPIPDQNKRWMESWSKYCPDYEIIEWNESNYDISKNKYMEQAYQTKKWGFVPDYARLDIIYEHGGIYLDTDVEIVRSLDDLLYQKAFAGFESRDYVALGLGFGAQKGLSLIDKMRQSYEDMSFIKDDGTLNLVASPVLQTEFLKGYGLQCNGEYQIVDEMTIFPEKVLSGKSVSTRRVRLTEYTHTIHHYDGSWVEQSQKSSALRFERDMSLIEGNK